MVLIVQLADFTISGRLCDFVVKSKCIMYDVL